MQTMPSQSNRHAYCLLPIAYCLLLIIVTHKGFTQSPKDSQSSKDLYAGLLPFLKMPINKIFI
jgi:hypothetical protein